MYLSVIALLVISTDNRLSLRTSWICW